jgi:hypothetical protein
MFSPLEAAAYKGQLPEQRNPNAVNPQLKNLFAIQSAMEAKKHADAQLASALGQQTQEQPTVAAGLQQAAQQALKPETQSPREVATQNMGLPGLMQGGQGQPPQGQPPKPTMGQPPQAQAPQQMAAGGLAGARSNLPSSYAGGGIVAFDGGGSVDERRKAALAAIEESMPDTVPESFPGSKSEYYRQRQLAINAVKAQMPESNIPSAESQAARLSAYGRAPVAAPAPQDTGSVFVPGSQSGLRPEVAPAAPAAPVDKAPVVRPPVAASSAPAAAPSAPSAPAGIAGLGALREATMKDAMAGMAIDPEAAKVKASAEREAALGSGQRASIAAQQGGIDKLAALQATKAGNRPSQFWETINAIGAKGSNVLPGQWGSGVAGAVQKAQEGYADEDIANQTKINALTNAMNKAKEENDIGTFNAAREAFIQAQTAKGMARKDAVTLADSLTRSEEHTKDVALKVQQLRDTANQHAATLRDGLTARGEIAAAKQLEHSREGALARATKASETFINNPAAAVGRKGATADSVFNETYNREMKNVPGFVPMRDEGDAATGSSTLAAADAILAKGKGTK